MFIQVIQGHTSAPAELRTRFEAWRDELAAGAAGWLGATEGVTDDGEFIAVVRFESRAAAARNSDRPEQGEWWAGTEKYFDGPVAFHDYSTTWMLGDGGSDAAGFVQVLQGHMSDPDRARALSGEVSAYLARLRPDVIGGTVGVAADGHFTQTVYFTSEEEARAGEQRMEGADEAEIAHVEELRSLTGDVRYLDLTEPRFMSP